MSPADQQMLDAIADRIAGGIVREPDGTSVSDDRAFLFGLVQRLRKRVEELEAHIAEEQDIASRCQTICGECTGRCGIPDDAREGGAA